MSSSTTFKDLITLNLHPHSIYQAKLSIDSLINVPLTSGIFQVSYKFCSHSNNPKLPLSELGNTSGSETEDDPQLMKGKGKGKTARAQLRFFRSEFNWQDRSFVKINLVDKKFASEVEMTVKRYEDELDKKGATFGTLKFDLNDYAQDSEDMHSHPRRFLLDNCKVNASLKLRIKLTKASSNFENDSPASADLKNSHDSRADSPSTIPSESSSASLPSSSNSSSHRCPAHLKVDPESLPPIEREAYHLIDFFFNPPKPVSPPAPKQLEPQSSLPEIHVERPDEVENEIRARKSVGDLRRTDSEADMSTHKARGRMGWLNRKQKTSIPVPIQMQPPFIP